MTEWGLLGQEKAEQQQTRGMALLELVFWTQGTPPLVFTILKLNRLQW